MPRAERHREHGRARLGTGPCDGKSTKRTPSPARVPGLGLRRRGRVAGRELPNEVSAPESGCATSPSGRRVGCPAGISKRTRRPGPAEGALTPSAAGSAARRKVPNELWPPLAQRRSALGAPELRNELPPPAAIRAYGDRHGRTGSAAAREPSEDYHGDVPWGEPARCILLGIPLSCCYTAFSWTAVNPEPRNSHRPAAASGGRRGTWRANCGRRRTSCWGYGIRRRWHRRCCEESDP